MFAMMAIKPKYADAILDGQKKYEFRKARFSREVRYLILYATSPIGKLVGWTSVDGIIVGSPSAIWRQTSEDAGISHDEFLCYFNGTPRAVCIKLRDAHRFNQPLDPRGAQSNFVVPQSYRYLTEDDLRILPRNLKDRSLRFQASSTRARSEYPFNKRSR